jgi:excinuclease ABC subunit C
MAIHELKDQIARLPEQPGVYLYLNTDGETIYVGKARSLRDRVRSYLGAYGSAPKTDALLEEVSRLEIIVTDSVVEALALENNLIKQRSPKYNIRLRDDKNYPYLRLTANEPFPRVLVARGVEVDGSVYAGPFMPAAFARKTMALTHRLFGIRSCSEVITGKRGRPCLEHDIKRCIAPCVDSICTAEQYREAVRLTGLFLESRNDELVRTLQQRMQDAAAGERFEEAAQLRDAIRTIESLRNRQQKMATADLGQRDVFGIKVGSGGVIVEAFEVRNGRVVERVELGTEDEIGGSRQGEALAAALQQFYELRAVPQEVHVPVEPDEREALEAWLSERAGRRVRIVVPQRGPKRELVDLATRNAALAYETRFNQTIAAHYDALERLQAVLALPALPRRIEAFDISTIQGSETVASLVVCQDGRMRRSEYRTFKIRGLNSGSGLPPSPKASQQSSGAVEGQSFADDEPDASGKRTAGPRDGAGGLEAAESPRPLQRDTPDDFAAMHEVVLRRCRRLLENGGPFPDLILIDGGKGQLSAAYGALELLGLGNLVAVSLAKKEELLFMRDRPDPIALAHNDAARLLVQRIRDEAHRVAVTFHRGSRTRRDLRSELDAIPGIGAKRRRQLLTGFGSVAGVRRATREELAAVIGAKAADRVLAFFAGRP